MSFLVKVGDYILVRSNIPQEQMDDIVPKADYCYVPGIVQVTPLRQRSASKCYTVVRHNGTKVYILLTYCLLSCLQSSSAMDNFDGTIEHSQNKKDCTIWGVRKQDQTWSAPV